MSSKKQILQMAYEVRVAAMIVSLTISSLIAVGVMGYLVLSVLSRQNIIEPLKSRGLKVVDQG